MGWACRIQRLKALSSNDSDIFVSSFPLFIELDYGKNYRKTLYLMVKTMVSCRFSLNQDTLRFYRDPPLGL